MPGQTPNNEPLGSWWQIMGVITLTAALSSIGSGIVSGYLAARAVATQVVAEQGKEISALDLRITSLEVETAKMTVWRLDQVDERLKKLEERK